MAVGTRAPRRFVDDPSEALQRNRTEDARLLQRINGAATELHSLWSAAWPPDTQGGGDRSSRVRVLQAEIDGLYERRRQLVAERALLRDAPRTRNLWRDVRAA